jgi:Fe-S cluster assembly protein SufD
MADAASLRDLLPTRRVEAWKYSDLRAAAQGVDGFDISPDWHKFVMIRPDPCEKIPDVRGGTVIADLARALNDSGTHKYRVVRSSNQSLTLEWEAFAGAGGHAVEIVVEPGASLDLTELWTGESRALGAVSLRLEIGEGAQVWRQVIQRGSEEAVLLSDAEIAVHDKATLSQLVLAEGAKLVRIETHVSIEGEGAEVELNGIYMVGDGRHADLTSVVTHKAGGSSTRQLVKGVARKGGRGVFQGKIHVEHGAQKTDARQHHQALLLEEGGEIDAKPELEIFADDVQCAHGNAIGALDENQLFYARARGIPEGEARALLVEAFLAEAIAEDLQEQIREELLGRVRAWLRGGTS